ncbi:Subtilisin-like protease SBT4.4 [Euphorbia peplus]|nr:Subtilisin-like protease SBT4.4 [Euphorbia peplus]
MANLIRLQLYCLSLFLIFIVSSFSASADGERKLQIVYMGSLTKGRYSPSSHHLSLLQRVIKSSSAQHLLVKSYGRSFNGFAAMLSDDEVKQLQSSKEVVSVFPSITYDLQTTRSWSFMGFEDTDDQHPNPSAKSDVIIGVLDTGIWPESESFSGKGFQNPPMKWKGACDGGENFTCNKKLIGARVYGYKYSTRDDVGHGNSGPSLGSVASIAPWTLSVGASSTDRKIIGKVILGNGKTLVGNSVNSFDLNGENFPLINGVDAKLDGCEVHLGSACIGECLDENLVKGKILVCDNEGGVEDAANKGAIGAIVKREQTQEDVSNLWPIPAVVLNDENFGALQSYMKSSKNPVGKILKSEEIKDSTAPLVASFSSRGPNKMAGDLLKPDIVAPGIDILAAYPLSPPTSSSFEKRKVKYTVMSGTSMACPHAAGVAAYVRTFHPEWSPSAIQSAIMTTALPMNSTMNTGCFHAVLICCNVDIPKPSWEPNQPNPALA